MKMENSSLSMLKAIIYNSPENGLLNILYHYYDEIESSEIKVNRYVKH